MNMMTRVSLLCLLGVALVCQPVNGFAAFVKYYDNPTTVFSKPLNMTRKAKQPPKVAWAEIDVFQQQVSLVPLYRQPIAPVHSWLPIAQLVYFGILSTNKNTVSCWNRKFWIRFGTMRKMIRLYWPYRRRRLTTVFTTTWCTILVAGPCRLCKGYNTRRILRLHHFLLAWMQSMWDNLVCTTRLTQSFAVHLRP